MTETTAFIVLIIVGLILLLALRIGEDEHGLEYGDTYDFYDDSNNSPYSKHPRHYTDHQGNEK